jgi:hypothetical protein
MFTVQPLLDGYLVKGRDAEGKKGSTILHSPAWDAYQASLNFDADTAEYNSDVMAFYQPLFDAAEKFEKRRIDPAAQWSEIKMAEAVEGVPGKCLHLDPQGVLLRILDETDGDLLRWVNGELVALLK